MQNDSLTWNTEPPAIIEIRAVVKPAPLPTLTEARVPRRRIRFTPPALPRRGPCRTQRALLAALRKAELALWEATGGDYLQATHRRVA